MAVDIGSEAIDRPDSGGEVNTNIEEAKPSTINGTITSIDIWAKTDITGLRVGTFYTTNGNILKCRDSDTIAGTITAGSKVTKAVSIAVEIGDYIGCYLATGSVEFSGSGFTGVWQTPGEHIDPGDEAEYDYSIYAAISLGGYIPVAPTVTTQAVDGIGFD